MTIQHAAHPEARLVRSPDGKRLLELPASALREVMLEKNRFLLANKRRSARAATTTATVPTPAGIRQQGPWAIAYSLSAERRSALKKAGRWEAFCAENPWARAYDTV